MVKNSHLTHDDGLNKLLFDCFDETPLVLMCFASPLVTKFYDDKVKKVVSKDVQLLDFNEEFRGAKEGIAETQNKIKVEVVQGTINKF